MNPVTGNEVQTKLIIKAKILLQMLEMDMISIGPSIHGAHSPDERASISSAQKYWKFVLEILQNIPVKK